jgi:hypothetical protein
MQRDRRGRRRGRLGPRGGMRGPRGGVFGQRRPRYLPRDAYGRRRSSAGGWIVGLILVALIGLGLWYFLSRGDEGSTVPTPTPVPSVSVSVAS